MHTSHLTRSVVRRLRRDPLFTLVTVATLGIAIGANAAIFSVANAVLVRPLPFPESQRLVGLWHTAPGIDLAEFELAEDTFLVYRKRNRVFEDMAIYAPGTVNLTAGASSEEIRSAVVSASLFDVLRVSPELGGLFAAPERRDTEPSVLLSHALWQRRFGADPKVVGRTIEIDGASHTVAGVMPASFHFPNRDTELWSDLEIDPARPGTGNFSYQAVARLRPGFELTDAAADLSALVAKVPEEYPSSHLTAGIIDSARVAVVVEPLRDVVVGDVSDVLEFLLASAGAILLIACANVANLFLARAEARQQELAVHAAVGATSGHLARALLAESTVLAFAGAALGLVLAAAGVRALVTLGPQDIPRLDEITVDGAVFAATLGLALLCALCCAVLPAWRGLPNLGLALKEGGRTATVGRARHRTRHVLVVAQIALALVLLVTSGLMALSFRELRRVDPGFTAAGVLTLHLSPPEADYPGTDAAAAFHQEVLERIRSLPGVEAAAGVSHLPFDDNPLQQTHMFEDYPSEPGEMPPLLTTRLVAPGYFETLEIPLLAGRTFARADLEQPTAAVVINDALARRFWGDESPIGKRLAPETVGPGVWYTVVGVVGSCRQASLDKEPQNSVYYPLVSRAAPGGRDMHPLRGLDLVIRTSVAPASVIDVVRAAVWEVDATVPVARVRTLEKIVQGESARSALTLLLLLAAAVVAMGLGAVGLYGVVSYVVSLRTHEIGVRMALGADRSGVRGMVLRQGLVLALFGVVAGLAGAYALNRPLASLLYGVSPRDPVTFAAVAAFVLTVAMFATYLPAQRAASVDPLEALHHE